MEQFIKDCARSVIDGDGVRSKKLAMEALPPLLEESSDRNVIDARHRFAKKRHEEQYSWKPSAELTAAIAEAIFAKTRR